MLVLFLATPPVAQGTVTRLIVWSSSGIKGAVESVRNANVLAKDGRYDVKVLPLDTTSNFSVIYRQVDGAPPNKATAPTGSPDAAIPPPEVRAKAIKLGADIPGFSQGEDPF